MATAANVSLTTQWDDYWAVVALVINVKPLLPPSRTDLVKIFSLICPLIWLCGRSLICNWRRLKILYLVQNYPMVTEGISIFGNPRNSSSTKRGFGSRAYLSLSYSSTLRPHSRNSPCESEEAYGQWKRAGCLKCV